MATTKKKKPARRKSTPPLRPAPGTFSARERAIFSYWDGTRQVSADPLEIQGALLETDGADVFADFKVAMMKDEDPFVQKQAREAFRRIVFLTRTAFKVEAFSEENGKTRGLTAGECFNLLVEFGQYLDTVKKNTGDLPTESNPMEAESSAAPSPPKNSSDSTLIKPESPTDEPLSSPSAPE